MADDARLQIVLEAKIDKLTERLGEANRQVSRSAQQMSHDIEETNGKWERLFLGEGPGKAIESVFSRSRLAVLEEGGAKIGVFGSALETLGPAGIAAGAGLFALGEAAEQVRKAMEFADDIDRVSKSLGISTTALQEFDSAAIATSVGQDKSREALSAFNEVFNKYASGLASAKQGKFLNALGFTPESARQVTDIGDAVQMTLRKLAALPNQGQRASLAAQLGLSNFNVVLGEGTEGVDKFVAKMKEAQAAGEIISPAQIARAAELNDQVEALQHRIGQELKGAFVDLAPYVEGGFEKLEHFTSQLAHLIGQVPDAVRGIADIAGALSHLPGLGKGGLLDLSEFKRLQDQGAANDQAYARRVHDGQHPIAAFINDVATYDIRNAPADLARRGRAAALRLPADTGSLAEQLKAAGREAEPPNRGIVDLSRFNKQPKEKKGPEDQTASFDASAQNADLAAQRDLTAARREAAATIRRITQASTSEGQYAAAVAAAAAENEAKQADITADLAAKLAKYDQEIAKAQAAAAKGTDASAVHQVALLQAARAHAQEAAATRGVAAAEEATAAEVEAARARDVAQANQAYDLLRGVGEFTQAVHRVQGGYARSSGERRAADLTGLDDEKYQQDLARRQKLTTDLLAARGSGDEASRVRDLNAQFGVDQGRADQLHALNRAKVEYDDVSPLRRFAQEGVKSAGEVRDAFEDIATHGIDQLNDGLADAIVNGKSLGDVFKSVFASMEADAIKYLAKQAEIGLFGGGQGGGNVFSSLGSFFGLSSLPGHAIGADSFGGATRINEDGPEGVAFVPRGTQIIPNDTLRGLAKLDPAQLGRGGGQITQQFHLHAEGALMTDELVRGLSAQSQVLSRAAAADAVGQNNQRQARRARYSRPL